MKQRSAKSLQTTSLCYFNAKSTIKVPLTFTKGGKAKHENFNFVHFRFSSAGITRKVYGLCKY